MSDNEELPNDQLGLVTCHSVNFTLRQGGTDTGQLHPEAHRYHWAVLQLQEKHFGNTHKAFTVANQCTSVIKRIIWMWKL